MVEKKDAHSDMWMRANDIPCIDTKLLVPDLIENSDYQFRVIALNAAGPSEPSPPTMPTKVKEKIGECLSDLCSERDPSSHGLFHFFFLTSDLA